MRLPTRSFRHHIMIHSSSIFTFPGSVPSISDTAVLSVYTILKVAKHGTTSKRWPAVLALVGGAWWVVEISQIWHNAQVVYLVA